MSATVEAGGEIVVMLRVRNTTDVVEEYHVDVVGDPALWCTIEPAVLRLYPQTTGSVSLTFAPPRSPDAEAGPHPYAVRVRPTENPDAVSVPEGNLSVIGFTAIQAELLPVTVRGWRRAKPRLVVDNNGNTTVTTAVLASSPGNRVDFDIRTPSFQVPPGRAHFSVLKLKPERLLWLGRRVSHPYTTTVQPSGSEPATVHGTYLQNALLPTWMTRLGMLLAGLLAVFLVFWFLARPAVSSKTTAQVNPAPTVGGGQPPAQPPAQAAGGHKAPAPRHRQPPEKNPGGSGNSGNHGSQGSPGRSTGISVPAPVSWWRLHDGSGSTAADVRGAHPAAGSATGWCSGRNCATFNGHSSYFRTSGPVLNTGSGASFTVAAWVDLTSIPPSQGFATAVSQSGNHASGFFLQYSGTDKRWAFSRVANDVNASVDPAYRALSNGPPALNRWTYLVGVFNGASNQQVLYVNGVAQNDAVTDPTPFAASNHLEIGLAYYLTRSTDWWRGAISNAEVFNVALSRAQVRKLYTRTR